MTTTLRQPPSATNWDRLLTATGTRTVRDLVLDGNRDARAWGGGYDMEQSANLYLHDGTFDIDRLTLRDSPGDGILVGINATVDIADVTADACFRGGLTIVGGNTSVVVDNLQCSSGATPTYVQIEVDNTGDGGSMSAALTMTNSRMSRTELQAYGAVALTDCTVDGGLFVHGAGGATVRLTDTPIGIGTGHYSVNSIYWPRDVKFTRCAFTGNPLYLYPQVLGQTYTGQRIEFEDCTFVGTGDQAIYNYGDDADRGNEVVFTGTNTYSGFTVGYVTRPGWFATVTGSLSPA